MHQSDLSLRLCRLGIDTYKEAVIYVRKDSAVCQSEGFGVHARVRVTVGNASIIATLHMVDTDILKPGFASLSDYAWGKLEAMEGMYVTIKHPKPVASLSAVHSKIYGHTLSDTQLNGIVTDIHAGRYSDIQISSFLTACAGGRLSREEIIGLTRAMVDVGDTMSWSAPLVVDKHCVGGLPGNRTTPIVVAIVAAYGIVMPKTSSRAITSPAGTADTMEVLAPVDLSLDAMRRVVEKEQGCIVWGGAVSLSPTDDILIRVEKALQLDSEGQLVASVLSKKIAAGSSHIVLDIPVGSTAKVRNNDDAEILARYLKDVATAMGVGARVIISDGTQPVGCGVGPALEAADVVAVLQNTPGLPEDLKQRSITLAGAILEFSGDVDVGCGQRVAQTLLENGKAWKKFQAICRAQGGMREIPVAPYQHVIEASVSGTITHIDNRKIALVAKLAGAPNNKAAGLYLHAHMGDLVSVGQPLFTIHAHTAGELAYVCDYIAQIPPIMEITI